MLPFALLAELAAHEKQLFPRLRVHVAEQEPEIGELLPFIARHSTQQRALAVHHLVVGKRQDEIFLKGIDHSEGETMVMIFAIERILGKIVQGVMHPTHVPLETKS